MGIHRVAAAELVSQMLSAHCLPLDAAIVEHRLLPLLTQLTLTHPNNSTLQCVMLRAIRCTFDLFLQAACHWPDAFYTIVKAVRQCVPSLRRGFMFVGPCGLERAARVAQS